MVFFNITDIASGNWIIFFLNTLSLPWKVAVTMKDERSFSKNFLRLVTWQSLGVCLF